jgi:uncharacterized protein
VNTSDISAKTVEHHPERNCFSLSLNGKEALLEYHLSEREGSGSINFTHTFVPVELRGQGLAEALVRRGIAWAREQNYQIHASCWYAARFLR